MNDPYQTRQFFNMKQSELKQIIKEEVYSALNEAESSELAKMVKDIKNVLDRKVASPTFDREKGDKFTSKEPTVSAMISTIEDILRKYK